MSKHLPGGKRRGEYILGREKGMEVYKDMEVPYM